MIPMRLPRAAACILTIIAAVGLYSPYTWASAEAQLAPSLEEFYQALVQHYDPSSLPKFEDLLKVTDRIAGARAEDITRALPAIFLALAHQDDNVKIYAASALLAISRRVDSAQLLTKYVGDIGILFDSSNPRLQATPTMIFLNMRPAQPPEVVPLLLAFLKRTDRDPNAQGGAIFTLVRIAPENPEVIAAIREFLSRPLDITTRIGALNALGNPNVKDVGLIAMVITSLDDSDPGVRFTAAQVLWRMGKNALLQAEPALQRLANDPKQPANVTAAAKEALKGIPGRTN